MQSSSSNKRSRTSKTSSQSLSKKLKLTSAAETKEFRPIALPDELSHSHQQPSCNDLSDSSLSPNDNSENLELVTMKQTVLTLTGQVHNLISKDSNPSRTLVSSASPPPAIRPQLETHPNTSRHSHASMEKFTTSRANDMAELRQSIATLTTLVQTLTSRTNDSTPPTESRALQQVSRACPYEAVQIPNIQHIPLVQNSAARSSGELLLFNTEPPTYTPVDFSSGLSAGDNLPERTKLKIWENKLVNFYDLLYPDHENTYSFSLNQSGSTPSLNFTPRKRRNLNEQEWSRAFDDFLAVYTRLYPSAMSDLLTYRQVRERLDGTQSKLAVLRY